LFFINVTSLQFLMRLNKKIFKSNNFKNEYIDHSGFLHTSNRNYSVNHKIRNGIGKVFNLVNILKQMGLLIIQVVLIRIINIPNSE
jgi:hypothetical protein